MPRKQSKPTDEITELKPITIVKHPTMVVVRDASEQSLNAVIVFIRSGDSTIPAETTAERDLQSPRTETSLVPLADDFNAEDVGLYWDIPYSG